MIMLLGGIGAIILLLIVVMATPAVVYIKRDQQWLASDRSVEAWYR